MTDVYKDEVVRHLHGADGWGDQQWDNHSITWFKNGTLLVNITDRVRAVRGDLTTTDGTTVGIMIEGSVIAEDDQMWICVILPDQIWHSTLM